MVVFRPFVGEVLEGKLKKADKSGIYVSIGYFSDIFIPEHLLQEKSVFDEEEQLWVRDGHSFTLSLVLRLYYKFVRYYRGFFTGGKI